MNIAIHRHLYWAAWAAIVTMIVFLPLSIARANGTSTPVGSDKWSYGDTASSTGMATTTGTPTSTGTPMATGTATTTGAATTTATTTPGVPSTGTTTATTTPGGAATTTGGGSDFWRGYLFETELRASAETHGATPAKASGHAGAWFAGDGQRFNYWFAVFSEERVTGAHFHCGDPGEDGPIVVHTDNRLGNVMATSSGTSTRVYGEIGRAYLTNADIRSTGEGCTGTIGYPIRNLSDLARAMREGKIYANVHTATYPAGAARGQLTMYPGWR